MNEATQATNGEEFVICIDENIKSLSSIPAIVQSPGSLTILHLQWNQLRSDALVALHQCTNLSELNLSHNKISSLSAFPRLTKLRSLDVAGNRLSSLSPILNSNSDPSPTVYLPALTSLDATDNPLTSLPFVPPSLTHAALPPKPAEKCARHRSHHTKNEVRDAATHARQGTRDASASARAASTRLAAELQSLKAQLQTSEASTAAFAAEVSRLQGSLKEAQQREQAALMKAEEASNRASVIHQRMVRVVAEEKAKRVEEAGHDCGKVDALVSTLRGQLEASHGAASAAREEVERLVRMKERAVEMESENSTLKAERDGLRVRLGALEERESLLRRERDDAQARVACVQQRLADADARASTLEEVACGRSGALAEVEKQMRRCMEEAVSARSEADTLRRAAGNATAQVATLTKRLEEEASNSAAQISALKSQVRELERMVSERTEKGVEAERDAAISRGALSERSEALALLQAEHAGVQRRLGDMVGEVARMKEDTKELHERKDDAEARARSLGASVTQMRLQRNRFYCDWLKARNTVEAIEEGVSVGWEGVWGVVRIYGLAYSEAVEIGCAAAATADELRGQVAALEVRCAGLVEEVEGWKCRAAEMAEAAREREAVVEDAECALAERLAGVLALTMTADEAAGGAVAAALSFGERGSGDAVGGGRGASGAGSDSASLAGPGGETATLSRGASASSPPHRPPLAPLSPPPHANAHARNAKRGAESHSLLEHYSAQTQHAHHSHPSHSSIDENAPPSSFAHARLLHSSSVSACYPPPHKSSSHHHAPSTFGDVCSTLSVALPPSKAQGAGCAERRCGNSFCTPKGFAKAVEAPPSTHLTWAGVLGAVVEQRTAAVDEIERLKTAAAKLKASLKQRETDIEVVTEEANAALDKAEARTTELAAQLEAAEAEVVKAKEQACTAKERVEEVEGELERLTEQAEELKAVAEAAAQGREESEEHVANMRSKLETLLKKFRQLGEVSSAAEAKVSVLEGVVGQLKEDKARSVVVDGV